tara:strand:- start:148 stop:1083 length:936 start_codon:yes stop_codon:yes gene_type:complete
MKDYFNDKEALDIPWVESPFFESLLQNSSHTEEEKIILQNYHRDGYIVVDSKITDEHIEQIKRDLDLYLSQQKGNRQVNYEYTESPRPFQLWTRSDAIKKLAVNENVMSTLKLLYAKNPFPFSTINFLKGSEQPMHSDAIHFHTIPQLWMVGVWVALEDVDEENGTLKVIPGSHKWGTWEYHNLKLPHPDEIENGEVVLYGEYEHFIRSMIRQHSVEPHIIKIKKGQAVIWASNTLHGSIPIIDNDRTRYAQAIHYFFEGCEKHYHPMFSKPYLGEYASKWCSDENNIKTFIDSGTVEMGGKTLKGEPDEL